jgi:hypothetical protein
MKVFAFQKNPATKHNCLKSSALCNPGAHGTQSAPCCILLGFPAGLLVFSMIDLDMANKLETEKQQLAAQCAELGAEQTHESDLSELVRRARQDAPSGVKNR